MSLFWIVCAVIVAIAVVLALGFGAFVHNEMGRLDARAEGI